MTILYEPHLVGNWGMCGRYVIPSKEAALSVLPVVGDLPEELFGRFNVSPTSKVPIFLNADGVTANVVARWGFVPKWWKDIKPPTHTFNARSEEVDSKPMWRESYKKYRCLIPATGWFEWKQVDAEANQKIKQPYFIYADEGVIFLGGMYSVLKSDDGQTNYTCTILTKNAEASIGEIHNRMPVIIKKGDYLNWMSDRSNGEQLKHFIENTVSDIKFKKVSTKVNSAKVDSPELIEEIE